MFDVAEEDGAIDGIEDTVVGLPLNDDLGPPLGILLGYKYG
jgi:hypothetical protein